MAEKTKLELEQENRDLRAQLASKEADPGRPAREGWKIITPIANYNGKMYGIEFRNGEAFVEDRNRARDLVSSFGYFSDPPFEDLPKSKMPPEFERRYMVPA